MVGECPSPLLGWAVSPPLLVGRTPLLPHPRFFGLSPLLVGTPLPWLFGASLLLSWLTSQLTRARDTPRPTREERPPNQKGAETSDKGGGTPQPTKRKQKEKKKTKEKELFLKVADSVRYKCARTQKDHGTVLWCVARCKPPPLPSQCVDSERLHTDRTPHTTPHHTTHVPLLSSNTQQHSPTQHRTRQSEAERSKAKT